MDKKKKIQLTQPQVIQTYHISITKLTEKNEKCEQNVAHQSERTLLAKLDFL